MNDVTVVVPTIPVRTAMLNRALKSINGQTLKPTAVIVEYDHNRTGAAATRQRALARVDTEFVAFCDDDDEWMPEHLAVLRAAIHQHAADYVYSYYMVRDATGTERPDVDPLQHFGRPFDPQHPHQTTIVTLVRTKLAQKVGFRNPPMGALIDGQRYGEDFQFTVDCAAEGAHIVHVPQRTWWWWHHGRNTSGMPDRW